MTSLQLQFDGFHNSTDRNQPQRKVYSPDSCIVNLEPALKERQNLIVAGLGALHGVFQPHHCWREWEVRKRQQKSNAIKCTAISESKVARANQDVSQQRDAQEHDGGQDAREDALDGSAQPYSQDRGWIEAFACCGRWWYVRHIRRHEGGNGEELGDAVDEPVHC